MAGSDAEDSATAGEPTLQSGDKFGRAAHKKKKTVSAVSTSRPSPLFKDPRDPNIYTPNPKVRFVMTTTTRRLVMEASNNLNDVDGRMELDTHTDTCVAGSNCVVLDLTGKVAKVSPFCEDDSTTNTFDDIPIATVATAYDCPFTGRTYILVINEALYFGDKMTHSLLCPNQPEPMESKLMIVPDNMIPRRHTACT